MAVVPPIPKASVNTAAAVKTGDNLNCRRAYRKLLGKLCMEHLTLLYALESRQVPKAGNRRTSSAVRRTFAECCFIDDSRSRLSRSCNREENPKSDSRAAQNNTRDEQERAHLFLAASQIAQFQRDPKQISLLSRAEPPDEPPIGADDDWDS